MAREIKATIALDGATKFNQELSAAQREVKNLQAELKVASNEFDRNGQTMEKNAAKVQNYAKQIEQQKKIVDSLKQAIKEQEAAGKSNTRQTDTYRQQLARAEDALNATTHAQQEAARAASELANNTKEAGSAADEMASSWEKAKDAMSGGFGDALSGIGKAATTAGKVVVGAVGTITAAATAGLKSIIDLEIEAANGADDILTKSATTGIDTQTLQRWTYAEDKSDVSVDTMISANKKLRTALADADTVKELGQLLGVRAWDKNGQRDVMDVFWDIIDQASNPGVAFTTASEVDKNELFTKLFGKSWDDLKPLINLGSEGYNAIAAEADSHGVVVDQETLEALGHLSDVLSDIEANKDGVKNALAEYFLPGMTELAEAAERTTSAFTKWLKGDGDTDSLIKEIESTITALLGDDGILADAKKKLDELIAGMQSSDNDYVSTLGNALKGVTDAFDWMITHTDEVVSSIEKIFAVLATIKGVQIAANLVTVAKGVTGLGKSIIKAWSSLAGHGAAAAGGAAASGGAATGGAAAANGGWLANARDFFSSGSTKLAGGALAFAEAYTRYYKDTYKGYEGNSADELTDSYGNALPWNPDYKPSEWDEAYNAKNWQTQNRSLLRDALFGWLDSEVSDNIHEWAGRAASGDIFAMQDAQSFLADNQDYKQKILEALPSYKDVIDFMFGEDSWEPKNWFGEDVSQDTLNRYAEFFTELDKVVNPNRYAETTEKESDIDLEQYMPQYLLDMFGGKDGLINAFEERLNASNADPIPVTIEEDNTTDLAGATDLEPLPVKVVDELPTENPVQDYAKGFIDPRTLTARGAFDLDADQQALAWQWYSSVGQDADRTQELYSQLADSIGPGVAEALRNYLMDLGGELNLDGFSQLFSDPDLSVLEDIQTTVSEASMSAMASKVATETANACRNACREGIESANITATLDASGLAGFVGSYFTGGFHIGGGAVMG